MTAQRRYQLRLAHRRYRERHKNDSKVIARKREECKGWYWANRQKALKYNKAWREAHKEQRKKYNAEWHKKNRPPTGRPKTGRPRRKHLAKTVSLDNDLGAWHEIVASSALSPLELLIQKEESTI
jgi:hypothetical protein